MSEQSDATRSFLSGMGRRIRAVRDRVIPPPEPASTTPSPSMLGDGAASRAGEASRSATNRRLREAGVD